jgi:hypothetical protein
MRVIEESSAAIAMFNPIDRLRVLVLGIRLYKHEFLDNKTHFDKWTSSTGHRIRAFLLKILPEIKNPSFAVLAAVADPFELNDEIRLAGTEFTEISALTEMVSTHEINTD